MLAPWSGFWDRNLFVEAIPALEPVLASPFARGAVSGVGAVTVIAGLAELVGVFVSRHRQHHQAPPAGL